MHSAKFKCQNCPAIKLKIQFKNQKKRAGFLGFHQVDDMKNNFKYTSNRIDIRCFEYTIMIDFILLVAICLKYS